MAKRIFKYRNFTVADLIGRTDLPSNSSNIVSGASYMDVSNITTADVGSVIGSSSHQVHQLCVCPNINKWSAFSPYIRTVSGSKMSGVIVHSLPTGSTGSLLGSFAGYNKDAVTPSYYNSNRTTTISCAANSVQTFECQFTLGELIVTDNDLQGVNEVQGICFSVWTGATLVNYQVRDINTIKENCYASESTGFQVNVSAPVSGTQAYSCKLFFIESPTTYSYNSNEVCQVFSDVLPAYTKNIRVQTSSVVAYVSSPYPPTVVSSGFTLSTGHFSFAGMTIPHTFSTGLRIQCWIEGYDVNTDTWTRVTSVTTIRDINRNTPYTSGTDVGSFNQHVWTTMGGSEATPPVPDYDYRLYLYFDGV
jgi:hypothetical protein